MADATRARLEDFLRPSPKPVRATQEVVRREDLRALLAAHDALRAERDKYQALWHETARMVRAERERQAQAAPLLAACQAWMDSGYNMMTGVARLVDAVTAWRAAREG